MSVHQVDGRVRFSKHTSVDRSEFQLPCGQCLGCRLTRSREWALRCYHESLLHDRNCFLTLTYDEEHLPVGLSVDKAEWQRFAKKVRNRVGSFRFLHSGEYGDHNHRPHYHAVVFGQDFSEDRVLFRSGRWPLYVSETLQALWPNGFSTIGDFTYETAQYVAGYVVKKLTGQKAKQGRVFFDHSSELPYQVESEYGTMSRRPGLGAEWFERFRSDVYPSDECVVKGRRFRPPRYYDLKLEEAELEVYKERRRVAAKSEDATEQRLRVREKVAQAQRDFRKRRSI